MTLTVASVTALQNDPCLHPTPDQGAPVTSTAGTGSTGRLSHGQRPIGADSSGTPAVARESRSQHRPTRDDPEAGIVLAVRCCWRCRVCAASCRYLFWWLHSRCPLASGSAVVRNALRCRVGRVDNAAPLLAAAPPRWLLCSLARLLPGCGAKSGSE